MGNRDQNHKAATDAANEHLWAAHPELNRRQLTMDVADASLRREWMASYDRHLRMLEVDTTESDTGIEADSIVMPCKDESQKASLSVHLKNDLNGADIVGVSVRLTGGSPGDLSFSETTNCAGYAEFTDLSAGHYLIEYTYLAQHHTDEIDLAPNSKNEREVSVDFEQILISDLNSFDLMCFFSMYENNEIIPPVALENYLTTDIFFESQKNIIRHLICHVQCAKEPLSRRQFYEMAYGLTGDEGASLMACHNITKALARGYSPLNWSKLDVREYNWGKLDARFNEIELSKPTYYNIVYSLDGQPITFDSSRFHEEAQPIGSRNQPTAFYAMFSQNELGKVDEGDWYHFYLNAVITYYCTISKVSFPTPGKLEQPYNDQMCPENIIYSLLLDTISHNNDATLKDESDTYRGWCFANSLSFLEGAKFGTDYGGTQNETCRESRIHLAGARFGVEIAGESPNARWRWNVPIYNAALGPLDVDVNIEEDRFEILNIHGEQLENQQGHY